MFAVDTRVVTDDGPGVVLEYARVLVAPKTYEERPLVHLDDGTLRVYEESALVEE